jgi:hypothetical protein
LSATIQRIKRPSNSFPIYRSFAATVPQLKISDISGEMFKGFEVLYFSMSATTIQLLSSG